MGQICDQMSSSARGHVGRPESAGTNFDFSRDARTYPCDRTSAYPPGAFSSGAGYPYPCPIPRQGAAAAEGTTNLIFNHLSSGYTPQSTTTRTHSFPLANSGYGYGREAATLSSCAIHTGGSGYQIPFAKFGRQRAFDESSHSYTS